MKCRILLMVAVLVALATGVRGAAKDGELKITVDAKEFRDVLPKDGELIAQGRISKGYVGLSLGHEVRAQGKRVYVGKKLSAEGVVFRDGFVEVNAGIHVEQEKKVLVLRPTIAVDIIVKAKLSLDENLKATITVEHLRVEGDNLGGKVFVAFAKDKAKNEIRKEVAKLADKITAQIQKEKEKLPNATWNVQITPAGVVLTPKKK